MHINILFTLILISHGVDFEFFENAKGIRFFYEDGTPISFADYKIYSPDGKIFSEGILDKNGRVLFFPDKIGKWKIEVDDGMGHGIIKEFEIKNLEKEEFIRSSKIPIYFKILFGISIIFNFTGIIFYIMANKKLKDAYT